MLRMRTRPLQGACAGSGVPAAPGTAASAASPPSSAPSADSPPSSVPSAKSPPRSAPSAESPPGSAPSAMLAPSALAGPASDDIVIEYGLYDHRMVFVSGRATPYPRVSVDVILKTDSLQRLIVGTFEQAGCEIWHPNPMAPVISQLDCIHDGPIGKVELVRVAGSVVQVRATEGGDGPDAAGGRDWQAGTFELPPQQTVASVAVDRDLALRKASKRPALQIRLVATPRPPVPGDSRERTLKITVATTPPQSVVIGPWDLTGCEMWVDDEDAAQILSLSCPREPPWRRESLYVTYVSHDTAEVWAYGEGTGLVRRLGHFRLPRDRRLDVRLLDPTASAP